MKKARIVRDITGFLLVVQCAALIGLFGVLPMLNYSACPVLKEKSESVYAKGSLVFVREIDGKDWHKGDIAVFYRGDTPVGLEVISNNKAENSVIVNDGDGPSSVAYRKLNGRGTSFSVPLMGYYANWLNKGKGVPVTVIAMGVLFVLFGVSAFMTKDD